MRVNHPKMAKEWAKHTPSIKALPERASKPKPKPGKKG